MDGSDLPVAEQVDAERKLVTVVVCEIGGPTTIGEDDLEDHHQLLERVSWIASGAVGSGP
jgi:hypothetical protein